MKKILFGILAIFLLSIVATSVNAVTSSLSWNTAGTVLPTTLAMSEDVADNSFGDLSQYVTQTDGADTTLNFASVGSTHITVSWSGDIPTLTPDADWYGTETIVFTATDSDDSVNSPSISVTVNSVNDNPTITITNLDQTKAEDSASWTLDLTAYESDVEDLPGPKLTWSVSGVDTTKLSVVVTDSLNDVVTFTPVANAIGSDLITLTLTDSNSGTDTLDILVTLTSLGNDDAPTVTTIPDQKWNKGTVHTLDLKNYFVDPDDVGTLTYGWTGDADLSTHLTFTESNGVVTFTPVSSSWKGTHYVNFTLSDGVHDTVTSNEVKLVVRDQPDFICEEGETGSLSIDSVSDPDDGDNFKPGEEIKIKVNIDNNYDEDLDVVVEAFLYDETDDKVIESVESESQEIKDGKDETFEFDLLIPLDEDLEEDHVYQVLLKVYEDGNEEDHCVESSAIDVDIERDNRDVIITKLDVTPTLVNPGETVGFEVKIENIGATDEDDVVVKLKETELGLDLESAMFDLEKATDDDNTQTVRFTFTVPSNIKADTYDIEAGVYDEDDDLFDASDDSEMFISLVVSGSAVTATSEVSITVSDLPSSIEAGKTYSIPVKITNNKAVQDTFTAKFTNIDDWATSDSEKLLTLKSAQSETVYLSLKANEEVGEGKYSATVQVTDGLGNVVGTKTITFGTDGKTDWSSYFSGNKAFWIIGDIILVIIAIFFIKLIFSRGKGKVKEVRL